MEKPPEQAAKLWQPIVAAVLFQLMLMALYVAKYNGDITSLVGCASGRIGLPPYQDITKPIGPGGHDGQFYYSIAQAPWRKHGDDLDLPSIRHLRIFYSAMCWLLSAGQPQWLFWIMPAVNLVALGGLVYLGGRLALHFDMNPWWGFAFPLALNAGLPGLHNLTDPLAILGIVWLLWGWLARAPWWTIALATIVALFSREQNLALAALVLSFALWERRFAVAGGVLAASALYAAWVGYLWVLYGQLAFLNTPGNFTVPLSGIIFRLTHLGGNDHFSVRLSIIMAAVLVHLAFQFGLLGYFLVRERWHGNSVLLLLTTGAGALIALTGSNFVYRDFWTITRVFVWMPLGLWILCLQAQRRWALALLMLAVLWPVVAALHYV